MDRNAFLDAVRDAGVVGEGGAGFPAHVKYAAEADTVIANGCECEPLLHTDHLIMREHAAEIVRALGLVGDAVGAKRRVLALKAKHGDLLPLLEEACAGTGVALHLLEDFYPAGDEQVLVREVTGCSVPPLGIPLKVRTVVANVGTLADVDAAVGGVFAAMTRKYLTVTGSVARPCVLRAPLGTPLLECLEAAGGALSAEPVFVLGGPMMGRVVEGLEGLAEECVTKTSGGIIALPAGHYLHCNASLPVAVMRRRAASACIQCRACSDMCPRSLLGHPLEPHMVMRAFALGRECSRAGLSAVLCCDCGACEHYACPMGMSPRRINQTVKIALRETGLTLDPAEAVLRPGNGVWREFRRIPVPRLAARLGIGEYMGLATPFIGDVRPQEVAVPLRQHIGAPATPLVAPGDGVAVGDCIGAIPEGALGARVHASVSGTVRAVTEKAIHIERAPFSSEV